jgi:hypothetical protein
VDRTVPYAVTGQNSEGNGVLGLRGVTAHRPVRSTAVGAAFGALAELTDRKGHEAAGHTNEHGVAPPLLLHRENLPGEIKTRINLARNLEALRETGGLILGGKRGERFGLERFGCAGLRGL